MREVRDDVRRWFGEGQNVALAQVTKTWGSSPRVPGSVMAVSADGRLSGSVSGGCIEGAVAQVAMDCADGHLSSLEKFHASTRRAQEVGLSCGGNIEVFVSALDEALFALEDALLAADAEYLRVTAVEAAEPSLNATDTAAPSPAVDGAEGGASLLGASFIMTAPADAERAMGELVPEARETLATCALPDVEEACLVAPAALVGEREAALVAAAELARAVPYTRTTEHVMADGIDWFVARVVTKPQLICIGGVHIAMRLCEIAHVLGYRTIVIDPRRVFATGERFPGVDELVHAWPQEAFKTLPITANTAVCALTHDPKIDVPALEAALDSPAFYIGSLGRTTTQLARYRALSEDGRTDGEIDRIFGPIGLDLRGREPAEIALSVMAEITAVRHGSPYRLATMLESARKVLAEKEQKAAAK